MSKEKRKERWGKVKDWLKTNAPKALNVVGDILPDSGALGIIKNILDNDPDISPEQQAQFNSLIKEMYELEVKSGTYTADSLLELCWTVFRHRLNHFRKGEGFRD